MPRSISGLEGTGERPAFRTLLPDLRDKRVLDMGCGFGWHCRYAREQGARSVVGVDLSEKMLARAKATTDDSGIEYRCCAIEDVDFPDGVFGLSAEHPMFTALDAQEWYLGSHGERLHWPVDDYQTDECRRPIFVLFAAAKTL